MLISKGYNPNNNLHPGAAYFLKYVYNRTMNCNQNFICAIIGPTGSGKSWSGLSFLENLNPGVDVFQNVCFKARTFMERLNDENLKKGTTLLWDEVGIDLNAKEWQNLINKVIAKVLQTFRRQNLNVFFTVPFLSFIGSDTRKLLHAFIKTRSIDKETKETVIKPYLIQVNEETGKMYRKYLRVVVPGKGVTAVRSIRMPKPSEILVNRYEEAKKKFTVELNKTVLEQIIEYEEKNVIKLKKEEPKLTHHQIIVMELYRRLKHQGKVAEVLGISQQAVNETLKDISKKLNIDTFALGNSIFKQNNPVLAPLLMQSGNPPQNQENNNEQRKNATSPDM